MQRKSTLSQREAEAAAAALIVSACPDKLIAKRIEVGLPTVRFHPTNAFRKLRADNRTQLAARVLQYRRWSTPNSHPQGTQ